MLAMIYARRSDGSSRHVRLPVNVRLDVVQGPHPPSGGPSAGAFIGANAAPHFGSE
jgi:hypothetical protein